MRPKFKGDSLQFHSIVDEDITNWKIRAELFDKEGNSVKYASANSGGSDTQIEKTYASLNYSVFTVFIPSGATTNFANECFIELEADTGELIGGEAEIVTIYKGKVYLEDETVDWEEPS